MAAEPRRKLDYSYILATPNDGRRYELVEGKGDTALDHPDWDGLVIDLAALWLQSPLS